MRIQTQFDIGDKLRATGDGEHLDFEVAYIHVQASKDRVAVNYSQFGVGKTWFPEEMCKLHGSFVHELDEARAGQVIPHDPLDDAPSCTRCGGASEELEDGLCPPCVEMVTEAPPVLPRPDWKDTSIIQEFDPSEAGRGVGEDDPK